MLKPTDRIDSWAYTFYQLFVRMVDRHQDRLQQALLQAQGLHLPLALLPLTGFAQPYSWLPQQVLMLGRLGRSVANHHPFQDRGM